ncbi:HAMP domain-containing sensor histidine kinase [Miniphocaeibacter massiliensis]|uniref:HAMP domain-containing sensor histidine kinase n=1 Tax=Miniphocaeibacter massiliensis TaxID=2041841 RepID=UPI000C06FD81|nr:HAMP domain-containing sensor histidine kinase [Miniphocaeibacter massiliensis]
MKVSIRNRVVLYFAVLLLSTIVVFEVFSMYSVKYYYYSVVKGNLKNEVDLILETYKTSPYSDSLESMVLEGKDSLFLDVESQIQILNNEKVVIYDSLGTDLVGKELNSSDISKAVLGEEGQYIGDVSYYDGKVMAVSLPIRPDEQKGVIRIITSLELVDYMVTKRYLTFVAFGIFVIALTISGSIVLANKIVKPLKKLNKTAEKLAEGQFNIKADGSDYEEVDALSRTLNIMSDNIKEKEKLKNDFISSVSHELRTPLTSINGWASTLLYEPEDSELVKEGLEIIQSECIRLSGMVEELLDFSRFTSNRITLEKEDVDVTELSVGIKKQLTPRAKSLGIDLIINFEPEHIVAKIDPDRIKQVLINLLDNALKFTDSGGVVIINVSDDEKNVYFEVIDTGIGIDSEEISLITGKFYKGTNSNSHTGLGLSICEEIIKLHSGEMMIESKINEGTTIKISLPKEEVKNEKN